MAPPLEARRYFAPLKQAFPPEQTDAPLSANHVKHNHHAFHHVCDARSSENLCDFFPLIVQASLIPRFWFPETQGPSPEDVDREAVCAPNQNLFFFAREILYNVGFFAWFVPKCLAFYFVRPVSISSMNVHKLQ